MERRSILVYSGQGSSHSWTWLADLFESHGVFDIRFVDTKGFSENLTDEVRAVIVSGGDGFRIASALDPHGFSHLKGFIHRGGGYIGICAGAYLPLPSTIEPFSKFNLSTTKIENIDCDVQSDERVSPRIAVGYGRCSIIHPVRGELELESSKGRVRAPLYGGPIFKEPVRDEVLVRYQGLVDGTELQVDHERAVSMIIGRPAVIRSKHGHGVLLLFGPHLEHPRYAQANHLFLELLSLKEERSPVARGDATSDDQTVLAHAIADLKVAILGLENRSFLVGNKLWDGGRFLELLSAIERRRESASLGLSQQVADALSRVRTEILNAKTESLLYADEGPELLVEAARLVVDEHFRLLRESRNR